MTSAASTRLVIADDHPLFRDALRHAVAGVMTSAKIDEAGSFDELTSILEQDSEIDLILLDLTMPGISGFSGLIYLRAQYPPVAGIRRFGIHSEALRGRDVARRDHSGDGWRRLDTAGYRSDIRCRSG